MRIIGRIVVGGATASALLLAPVLTGTGAAADSGAPVRAVAVSESYGGAAGPDGDEVSPAYTRGFTIWNLSSHTLKLLSVAGNTHAEDGVPTIGSTVAPGFSTRFEVTWLYFQEHSIDAHFAVLDAKGATIGYYDPTMTVYQADLIMPGTTSKATISAGAGQVQAGGDYLAVLNMPGTVIDIPAGQGQEQSQVLNAFCAANPSAKCVFTPTTRDNKAYTAMHPAQGMVYNNTPLEQSGTDTWTDTASITQSVEISASATGTVFTVVEVSLSATYGQSWTREHQFSTTQTLNIPAYWKGWLDVRDPVIRDTGDFTVTMGNTTWKLRGVSFDSPDKTRPLIYIKQAVPMTPAELEKYKPGFGFDPDSQATELDRMSAATIS